MIKKCSIKLRVLKFHSKYISGLRGIKGSSILQVLKLFSRYYYDMAVVESLPNLVELTGLYPNFQTDGTFLDKLFRSCGRTLEILEITVKSDDLPRPLFE